MKKRILISGKVHGVGYRPFLLGIAESLGIKKFYADNIYVNEKESVEILLETDDETLNKFLKIVKAKFPEKALVKEIEIEDYEGNVMDIEGYYRYLTAMQLYTIATYGGEMLRKQDMMLRKQDLMLDKQDMTVKEIRLTREGIKNEIRGLRNDINKYIDERIRKLEEEIKTIKQKIGIK